jgi:hypothetical protein
VKTDISAVLTVKSGLDPDMIIELKADGLNHFQKHRVQRLRSLEEAEAKYLERLRKACPDLADKVHHTKKRESRPPKKVWHPKPIRAYAKTLADAHMMFVLPAEFYDQNREELPVAQLDLGSRPVIFEKP